MSDEGNQPGEGVVACVTEGTTAAGDGVEGVAEEGVKRMGAGDGGGGGHSPTSGAAAVREGRRRDEGDWDTKAMEVEKLGLVVGEVGAGGQVEGGEGEVGEGTGGATEAGEGQGGEGRIGEDGGGEGGEDGVREDVLRVVLGEKVEETQVERAVGGGED